MNAENAAESARLAGDLTTEDVGSMVLDVPGIGGWAQNLLLRTVERDGGRLRLDFRWNDSPAPQNTQRGQFAIGVYVDPSAPVRVYPPADEIPQQPTCDDHGRCCTYRLCAHPKCCGYALPPSTSPVPSTPEEGS